jgi:hypothetical protein
MSDITLKEHLRKAGRIGGKTTGKSKLRGTSDYYKALSAKAARARKKK